MIEGVSSRMNPVFNGEVSKSNICESIPHWPKDCPHASKEVSISEDINIKKTTFIMFWEGE